MELNLEKGKAMEKRTMIPDISIRADQSLFKKALMHCRVTAADQARLRCTRAYMRTNIIDDFLQACGERQLARSTGQRRKHAAAETASDEESGLTRDRKERNTLVSSYIIDRNWKLVAERCLVKEARKRVNDPRRTRWRTIMDVPWCMTMGGESDLEDPVEIIHAGSVEQDYVLDRSPRMSSEEVYARDAAIVGPCVTG